MYRSVSVVDGFLGGQVADAGTVPEPSRAITGQQKVLLENLGHGGEGAWKIDSTDAEAGQSTRWGNRSAKDVTLAVQAQAEGHRQSSR